MRLPNLSFVARNLISGWFQTRLYRQVFRNDRQKEWDNVHAETVRIFKLIRLLGTLEHGTPEYAARRAEADELKALVDTQLQMLKDTK